MRTAYFWLPKIDTCATPSMRRQRRRDHLLGKGVEIGQRNRVADQRHQQDRRIGRIDLAVARRAGHLRRQLRCVRAIAACTSAAAASMSRSSSNWMAIEVEPSELVVEMESMPAIVANCLISGVATEVAIVSGEAPGSDADTLTTGNSALGKRGDRQEPVGEQAAQRSARTTSARWRPAGGCRIRKSSASRLARSARTALPPATRGPPVPALPPSRTGAALLQPRLSFDHHALAALQALADGAVRAFDQCDFDRAHLDRVVRTSRRRRTSPCWPGWTATVGIEIICRHQAGVEHDVRHTAPARASARDSARWP